MKNIEDKLDRIIELLEQLVPKAPTPRKKPVKQKLEMAPQHFAEAILPGIVSTSNHQWGRLGSMMRKLSTGEPERFVEYIRNEQLSWYEQNGHAFTMNTILKNFNRWLEMFRAGPVTPKRNTQELKIK